MPKLLAKTLKYIADNLEKAEDFEDSDSFGESGYYTEELIPSNPQTSNLIGFPQQPMRHNSSHNGLSHDHYSMDLSSSAQHLSEIILMEPQRFQDALEAVSAIRMRKLVVLNLSKMQSEDAQRAIDFVSGGTYMIDGDFEKIGEAIFLFMPYCIKLKDRPRDENLEVEPQNHQPIFSYQA